MNLKNMVAASILGIASTLPVAAQSSDQCERIAEFAGFAMTGRQMGDAQRTVEDLAYYEFAKGPSADSVMFVAALGIVEQAFLQPIEATNSDKAKVVQLFERFTYTKCAELR